MDIVIEAIKEAMKNGVTGYIQAFAIVLVVLIFNIKKIVTFWDERKKAKTLQIQEAIDKSSGITKEYLEDELVQEHFYRVTSINAEKQLREAILQSHRALGGKVNFTLFKRARAHFFLDDNSQLAIKIDWFDWSSFVVNLVLGTVIGGLGIIMVMLSTEFTGDSLRNSLIVLAYGLMMFMFGIWMLTQSKSVLAAKGIRERLANVGDSPVQDQAAGEQGTSSTQGTTAAEGCDHQPA